MRADAGSGTSDGVRPLAHVPPSLFGAVLGISGLGLAWRQAERLHGWTHVPGDIILLAGFLLLAVTLIAYAAKTLRYPAAVRDDLAHPVKGPFIGAMPLGIALQVPALAPFSQTAAMCLYGIAATLALVVHLVIFVRWHMAEVRPEQFNAVWLIPGVGSFIIAITGAPLGLTEIAWFFFAIGIGYWLFLSAILMQRYLFLPRHAGLLAPSYFILIVPPGLMSMIYPMLVPGDVAPFTRLLYYFTLFLLLLNLAMLRNMKGERFTLGFWAFTFPLDTATSASIAYGDAAQVPAIALLGQGLLIATTAVVAAISALTVVEMSRGRVFRPDPVPASASHGARA